MHVTLGKFRGFCYVCFENEEDVAKVFQEQEHIIKNKAVDIKPALSKEVTQEKLNSEIERKIFILKYDKELTEGKRYRISY